LTRQKELAVNSILSHILAAQHDENSEHKLNLRQLTADIAQS
jgi:hypothetical protein